MPTPASQPNSLFDPKAVQEPYHEQVAQLDLDIPAFITINVNAPNKFSKLKEYADYSDRDTYSALTAFAHIVALELDSLQCAFLDQDLNAILKHSNAIGELGVGFGFTALKAPSTAITAALNADPGSGIVASRIIELSQILFEIKKGIYDKGASGRNARYAQRMQYERRGFQSSGEQE